jgi:hypothetical protein
MEDKAMAKRMLKGRLCSKRRKGVSRPRWLDDVESDLKKMRAKGWKEKLRNRKQWRLVVKEVVAPRKKKKKKKIVSFQSFQFFCYHNADHRDSGFVSHSSYGCFCAFVLCLCCSACR